MATALRIGVIGDYDAANETHRFTDEGIALAARELGVTAAVEWLATDGGHDLAAFDGLVCAPGSPYRSMAGALAAIRYARENDVPLLGTCGGFQHIVIEYARNMAGIEDAAHAESDPYASRLVVGRLVCSLVGQVMEVELAPGSHAAEIFGGTRSLEEFYCNFGLNEEYRPQLEAAGMVFCGFDQNGEVRVVEVPEKRFCFGTLFVPQARAKRGLAHPLVVGFLRTAGDL
jgi:CTP synthase (UTP-ammonia lyase)